MTLPTGTVTFLRSDIEGSMGLARSLGTRYDELNAEHAAIVRGAIEAHAGEVVRSEGDAFFAVFTDAGPAARAAVEIQRAMADHAWADGNVLRVRIGLHSGTAVHAGDDYGGLEVSRAARIAGTGHGGQIVASDAARALIALDPPDGAELIDLGRHRLQGVPEPERLYQLVAPGLPRRFEALRLGHSASEHLPERMTTIVGREHELDELAGLLREVRLLTLTGPGGTGKTTLAVELARRHASEYGDGAWFIDLHTVFDADAARVQLARDLGIFDGPAGPATERLLPYLGERELLVVMDNLEQVRGAADLVMELISASRGSRFIATSRIPLRLGAEQEYAVRPLAVAPAQGEDEPAAVRLFLERARRYRHDLHVGAADRQATERICRLVDGLPLAIELCAARVALLPIGTIAERLAQHMPMPGSGPRDLPARQKTIEDTVAWSYELLEPSLQRLFTRLGVFDGAMDLEQAEAVCGPPDDLGCDVLEGLAVLVEQSLVVRVDDAVGGVRFRLLAPIRAFARDRSARSDELEAMQARHARAYLALAERLLPDHRASPDASGWLDRLEADDENLRQATRWAIDNGVVEVALGLVGYLWRFWVHSGRIAEGRELARAAMAMPGAGAETETRVWALSAAGSLAYWSNDHEQVGQLYEEQLALATALELPLAEADAWYNLLFVRRGHGDENGADEAASNAHRILVEQGATEILDDLWASQISMTAPAVLADPETQLPLLAEQIAAMERSDSAALQGILPSVRALYQAAAGDFESAARHMAQGLRLAMDWRRVADVITGLGLTAAISVGKTDPEIPATVLGALEIAHERYGITGPSWPEILLTLPPDPLAVLAEQLGPDGLERALQQGRQMTLEEIVDYYEDRAGRLEPT